jgi:hypothetical protein
MRLVISIVLVVVLAAVRRSQESAVDRDGYQRFLELTKSASAAYLAGDRVEATKQANELMALAPRHRNDWNYGNAVHAAHLVLGRIDVDADRLDEGKRRLLLSVDASSLPYGFESDRPKWKASPQMDTFGPDMTLAARLLEKGESETVIRYLDACSKFWDLDRGKLAKWKAEILEGVRPDFGPNLQYFFPTR